MNIMRSIPVFFSKRPPRLPLNALAASLLLLAGSAAPAIAGEDSNEEIRNVFFDTPRSVNPDPRTLSVASARLLTDEEKANAKFALESRQVTFETSVLFPIVGTSYDINAYDAMYVRNTILNRAWEDGTAPRQNLFCAIQMMYQIARDYKNSAGYNLDKYKTMIVAANDACRYALAPNQDGWAPQVGNTLYTTHLLATYARYKAEMREFPVVGPNPTMEQSFIDWVNRNYSKTNGGGTSNLYMIANANDTLLYWSGLYLRTSSIQINSPVDKVRTLANNVLGAGGPGEYASAPYGAQNLLPFLVLGNVALTSSDPEAKGDSKLCLQAFAKGLKDYSYSWLEGHLVAFSTRTYANGPITDTRVSTGLKSILAYYFQGNGSPIKTTFDSGGRKNLWLNLENHGLAAAVYPIDPIDPINGYNMIREAVERTYSRLITDTRQNTMGRMHTNSCYWRYFLSDNYGVYTENIGTSERARFIPMQTIPPGVLWKSASRRSNFFMCIPTVNPSTFYEKSDLFQDNGNITAGVPGQLGVQDWLQYGPSYVFVTGGKPFESKYIFGSMPGKYFNERLSYRYNPAPALSPKSYVIQTYNTLLPEHRHPVYDFDNSTPSVGDKKPIYRLFYQMSNEAQMLNPPGIPKPSVFIAITSPVKFDMGQDANGYQDCLNGPWYYDFVTSLSFKIDLRNPANIAQSRHIGVVVETARPDDFAGADDYEKLNNFIQSIRTYTQVTFTYAGTPVPNQPGRVYKTGLIYTDLNGNTLAKEYGGVERITPKNQTMIDVLPDNTWPASGREQLPFTWNIPENSKNKPKWWLPAFSSLPLNNAQLTVGIPYAFRLVATSALQPVKFQVLVDPARNYSPLPPGLSLDPASGTISGTPTTAGNFSGLFVVRNSAEGVCSTEPYSFTQQFSFTVRAQ